MTPLRFFIYRVVRYASQGANGRPIYFDRFRRDGSPWRRIHERHEFVGEARHRASNADTHHIRTAADPCHPSALRHGSCLATQLLRLPAILLRRELPLMVVETYLPSEYANYAWEAIFKAAHPLGPEPVGLDALHAEGWR